MATALAHFDDEEPTVVERIWATCTDEEIAACRAAFMAEIGPEESLATAELWIPATSGEERGRVLSAARASAPPAALQAVLDVAARTLSPSQLAALHAQLDEQAPTPVGV